MNDLERASTEVLMQGVGKPAAEGSYWNTEEEEAKGWPTIRLRMVSNRLENDPGCIYNVFHLALVSLLLRSTTPT